MNTVAAAGGYSHSRSRRSTNSCSELTGMRRLRPIVMVAISDRPIN